MDGARLNHTDKLRILHIAVMALQMLGWVAVYLQRPKPDPKPDPYAACVRWRVSGGVIRNGKAINQRRAEGVTCGAGPIQPLGPGCKRVKKDFYVCHPAKPR